MADNASKIEGLRDWTNNEVFNARDYVYERDTIISTVNQLIDYADYLDQKAYTKVWVQNDEPLDAGELDLWYEIVE